MQTMMSPRPPFLSGPDYIFYLKRQIDKDRSEYIDGPDDSKENSLNGPLHGLAIELPKLSELLRKLSEDLRSSCGSFIDEFIDEPNNGIWYLLDLLRSSLNRQQCPGMVVSAKEPSTKSKMMKTRDKQHQLKRAMSDEYDCLLCLKHATNRSQKTHNKILSHRSGLSTLASCIVSNFTKSRFIALELLTRVCNIEPDGANKVLEAMSTMRIVFGESVRFKLLVALLNSGSGSNGFESYALAFLNTLLSKSVNIAERVRLQCELQEAGLDINTLEKKLKEKDVPPNDGIWSELRQWREAYVNVVEEFKDKRFMARESGKLKEEIEMLQRALTKLEEDKISLMHIERELKEKCDDLESELSSFRTRFGGNASAVAKSHLKRPSSDSSDPISCAVDSGRWSDSSDGDIHHSDSSKTRTPSRNGVQTPGDSCNDDQNVRSEDILIYSASMRSPPSFASHNNIEDERQSQRSPGESNSGKSKLNPVYSKNTKCNESRWRLRQRNGSGTDKPTVVDVYPKKSNSLSGLFADGRSESALGQDCEETELTLEWQYPSNSLTNGGHNVQPAMRKKFSHSLTHIGDLDSEQGDYDRRDHRSSDAVDSQFMLKTRPNAASSERSLNSIGAIPVSKPRTKLSHSNSITELTRCRGQMQQPSPVQAVPSQFSQKSKNFASSLQSYFFSGSIPRNLKGTLMKPESNNNKSFPLPTSYKSSFIIKGHGTCGLYSGFGVNNKNQINGSGGPQSMDERQTRPGHLVENMSQLVHREIALAAKELGAWL